jgi:hypothetical protein
MPARKRRLKTVDRDQHLLHLRPMPVQRHRIAARRPGVAEADHAADIFEPDRSLDDGQGEDHVLAGVGRAVFFQDAFVRDAACDHRGLDDLALGTL